MVEVFNNKSNRNSEVGNNFKFDSQVELGKPKFAGEMLAALKSDSSSSPSPAAKSLKKSVEKIFSEVDNSADSEFWSLYKDKVPLKPLTFTNGKSQEDVVREVVELIRRGNKCIFLHGMCGTGKSAIALNIARCLGKAAVVVPVKNLQRQYEEDYGGSKGRMLVAKSNGVELDIASITGRDNHDSLFEPGKSCADPYLPDNIQITEKNFDKLKEYYEENPLVKNKADLDDVKSLSRISVAPANPYWSPIIPVEFDLKFSDAKRKKYLGLQGREFIFHHRKKGCSYYDQYESYLKSDVLIFNAAKYKIEVGLDRKPETEVDIIDEADEFLDNFSGQSEVNLSRLKNSLRGVIPEDETVAAELDVVQELVGLEENRSRSLGADPDTILKVNDTSVSKIFSRLLSNRNVESELSLDDSNYGNQALEIAKEFKDFMADTYVTFKWVDENLYASVVSTNLSKRLSEVLDKGKAFVFMSGTLHDPKILEKVYGLKDYKVVEAESKGQGEIEVIRTGLERDCSFRHFKSGDFTREKYLKSLQACVDKAPKPMLVHVNAFEDLPSQDESFEFLNLLPKELLKELQRRDRTGASISQFKEGKSKELYSTKCSRGVDFPGKVCNAMVFTKFPNPNPSGPFWKIFQRTHPNEYWELYRDKARREFLQRVYRAIRSKNDHVFVLSPDLRVLNAIRDLQVQMSS